MGLCPFFFIKLKMLNNRIDSTEIIKIADAVADEKSIDKNLVLNSMETAIEKAARTRYGSENEIYVKIDRETGKIELGRKLKVVEKVISSHSEIDLNEAKKINSEYKIGDVIPITVNFSENVTVSGTPQLTLETGSTDAVVNYSSGSSSNALVFNYTLASGHASSDLDYQDTTSLSLNGGTINDLLSSAAVLTLPEPAATNSLGANKAIIIDGGDGRDELSLTGNNTIIEVTSDQCIQFDWVSPDNVMVTEFGNSKDNATLFLDVLKLKKMELMTKLL